jgi:RNA recognition motif-containing protein
MSPKSPPVTTTATLKIPTSNAHEKCIIFGNIDANFDKTELYDHFSQFGNVSDIHVQFHKDDQEFKGLGFVKVTDDETFRKILRATHFFKATRLTVDHAMNPAEARQLPNVELRAKLTNIPEKMTKGQFTKLIHKKLDNVQFVDFRVKPLSLLSTGTCYVHFKNMEDLRACLTMDSIKVDFEG